MQYISTRGQSEAVDFATATLNGLAPDGGLYLPQQFPEYSLREFQEMRNLNYSQLAQKLLLPFVGDCISEDKLGELIDNAYADFPISGAPLSQLDDRLWLLELYHGPTLAFKDYALQLLAQIFSELLQQRQQKMVLLGATSGDTGAAAVAAIANKPNLAITMLHPHQRISPIQRRQMTTVAAGNVANIAIEGSFDDCQDIVKTLFSDTDLRQTMPLSSVNSINWARVMAQIVYYVKAALSLGAPERAIDFCVPSGNFGNIFAGYVAMKMGLPIRRLIVASNANDILHRMISNNDSSCKPVKATLSPSMDIQISSNFERLLFLLNDGDGQQTANDIRNMREDHHHQFTPKVYDKLREYFSSGMADDSATTEEIARMAQITHQIIDPHTAVGTFVARQHQLISDDPTLSTPTVVLATAYSAKFPGAMEQALSKPTPLPTKHQSIMDKVEIFTSLANHPALVRDFIVKEFEEYVYI